MTKKMMRRRLYCVLVLMFIYGPRMACGQEAPAFSRTIVGYVKTRDDHAVSGATICALGTRPISGALPCGKSNLKGRFAVAVWVPDRYTLTAEHIARGYPSPRHGFYGDFFGEKAVITVDKTNRLRPVTIRIGPKAGRLDLKMIDADTGKPVEVAYVKACRTDKPRACFGLSTAFPHGRYSMLAPEVPFSIKFQTRAGQDWIARPAIDESGTPIEVLQVGLSKRKQITVTLKRGVQAKITNVH